MQLIPSSFIWEPPADGESPERGVSEQQITAWEQRHRLTFPKLLRGPYQTQNGGVIQHGDIPLLPLERITWLGGDIWSMIHQAEPALSDPTRAVALAEADEHLLVLYTDDADQLTVYPFSFYTDVVVDEPLTLEEFIRRQHEATPEPFFAWDETTQGNVLFHERVPGFGGDPEDFSEYVITKTSQHLLIYERSPDTQSRVRVRLPVQPDGVMIERQRWRGVVTYELSFFGYVDQEAEVVQSERCSDGMWKTEQSNDSSMCSIESTNRATLEKLLSTIFGPEAARLYRREQRKMRVGTILFALFMVLIVLPLVIVLFLVSIIVRILTWPIRLLLRGRSGPPPAPPPGHGPVVIVKPE